MSAKCAIIIKRQVLHTLLEIFAHGDDPTKDARMVREAQRPPERPSIAVATDMRM